MCHIQYSVDRYPDNREILQKEEWINCGHGPASRPWDCRYEDQDEKLVYNIGRLNFGDSASDTSSRPGSSIGGSSRSTRTCRNSSRRPRPMTGLFLDAFIGERRTRTSRRSESRTRTSVVIGGSVRSSYPAPIPSPTYRSSFESTTRYSASPLSTASPITPRFEQTWEADIVTASPLDRGRGRRASPIVHNSRGRSRRNESTEVQRGPSRARTPSLLPDIRDMRARETQRLIDEERRQSRRERNLREQQLEHDNDKERRRVERRRREELENAAINARRFQPAVVQQHGILRHPSTRVARDSASEELRDTERGEQVLRQAIMENERHAREAAAETERRRLARRIGRGSERVEYRDDPYRR